MVPAVQTAAVRKGPSLHAGRRPATLPGDDRHEAERKYLRFAAVGIQFTLTILVLTVAGIWVDGRAGTKPLFTVVFLFLGFIGATWSLVHEVLGPDHPGPDRRGKKG